MTLGEFEFERSFLFFEAGGVTSSFLSPLVGVAFFAVILFVFSPRIERGFVSCPMDSRVAGGEEEENGGTGRGGSEGAGVMGGVG